MDEFKKIRDEFYRIQCMNWIKNKGCGYSSAGKTLENILGKDDDTAPLPDFQGIEPKTKVDGSEPFIGLFSMVPDSQPLLINKILKTYGWPSRKNRSYNVFYAQIYGNKFTSIGNYFSYRLFVDYKREELVLLIKNNFTFDTVTNISWSFQQLNLRLSKKLTLLALFNVKKFYVKEQNEYYFKYYKMSLYRLKGFDYFLRAVESGYIRLNIKIGFYEKGVYYGRIHNKGTTFEIEHSKLEALFDLVND